MDKRFVCAAMAVLAVAVGAAALATGSRAPEAEALHENVAGVERPPARPESEPAEEQAPLYAYVIREHEGRVAIFSADDEDSPDPAPVLVLNTLVQYLPDYDRGQLQQGIWVRDYQELVDRIEDFSS